MSSPCISTAATPCCRFLIPDLFFVLPKQGNKRSIGCPLVFYLSPLKDVRSTSRSNFDVYGKSMHKIRNKHKLVSKRPDSIRQIHYDVLNSVPEVSRKCIT